MRVCQIQGLEEIRKMLDWFGNENLYILCQRSRGRGKSAATWNNNEARGSLKSRRRGQHVLWQSDNTSQNLNSLNYVKLQLPPFWTECAELNDALGTMTIQLSVNFSSVWEALAHKHTNTKQTKHACKRSLKYICWLSSSPPLMSLKLAGMFVMSMFTRWAA